MLSELFYKVITPDKKEKRESYSIMSKLREYTVIGQKC
jgi:hypothetical protein